MVDKSHQRNRGKPPVRAIPWQMPGVALAAIQFITSLAGAEPGQHVQTLNLKRGDLTVVLRDNSESPRMLSGLDSLFNVRDAPGFDAFDPDGRGASAGLNFEHVICGHSNAFNAFSPRHGRYDLLPGPTGYSGLLMRKAEDDPWRLSSTFKYELVETNAIDFEFRCRAEKPDLFGKQRYAVLFFANYMNDVSSVAIHFRGVRAEGAAEEWISTDAPAGHADYNQGGTIQNVAATPLHYDTNHNFKLNLWSYEYPRFTQPFYYGRAAREMAFILMFDRSYTPLDEIRFSLFKFKVPRHPRPAWDFQYVIHQVGEDRPYGFRGRLIWKKFISAEDCQAEYHRWQSSLKEWTPAETRQ